MPFVVAKFERSGDRQGLGYTGRFDQQIIEAPLCRQLRNLLQEIIAQGAADAAIGHFDQLFIRAGQIGAALPNEGGIDVHFAHIIDDHRNAAVLAIVEHVVEQCRLSGSKKAGQDRNGQSLSHDSVP